MSTGDITQNINRLLTQLRQIKYPEIPSAESLQSGNFSAHKPILLFVLFRYSNLVSDNFNEQIGARQMPKDSDFMESVMKYVQSILKYRSVISAGQFIGRGYAERKILFDIDLIQLVKGKHLELYRFIRGAINKPLSPRPLPQIPQRSASPDSMLGNPMATPTPNPSRYANRSPSPVLNSRSPSMILKSPSPSLADYSREFSPMTQNSIFSVEPTRDTQEAQASPNKGGDSVSLLLRQLTELASSLGGKLDSLEGKFDSFATKTDSQLGQVTFRVKALEENERKFLLS